MFHANSQYSFYHLFYLLLPLLIHVISAQQFNKYFTYSSSISSYQSSPYEKRFDIRLKGGRNEKEGRIEIRLNESEEKWGTRWRPVCGHGWNLVPASIVCKSLDLGFAQFAITGSFRTPDDFSTANLIQSPSSSTNHTSRQYIIKLKCSGKENHISQCDMQEMSITSCPGPKKNFAGVICNRDLPDLIPNATELQSSIVLEDRPMYKLKCALEENCLAKSSYNTERDQFEWLFETRRLFRFTARITNFGKADFRPIIPKQSWLWHACHRHFHSMEVFAHFDILDPRTKVRVAEGHKASFCLEDNHCLPGTSNHPKYKCANFGDQGISVGCTDTYLAGIDCQWIDITDLPPGLYLLKVSINPEMKVAEITFDNNSVICSVFYNTTSILVSNCKNGPL